MAEVITVLTGFSIKPGSNAQGSYTLTKFDADDGKKYQTFDDDIAAQAKALIGTQVRITFEVQSRTNQGRTFTNNVISEVAEASASAPAAASSGGARGLTANGKVSAFRAAVEAAGLVKIKDPSFTDIIRIAESITAWAEGRLAGDDPEDAVPEADPLDAVPN